MSKSTGIGNILAKACSEPTGEEASTPARCAEAIRAAVVYLTGPAQKLAEFNVDHAEELFSILGGLCDLRTKLGHPTTAEVERSKLRQEVAELRRMLALADETHEQTCSRIEDLEEQRDELRERVGQLESQLGAVPNA